MAEPEPFSVEPFDEDVEGRSDIEEYFGTDPQRANGKDHGEQVADPAVTVDDFYAYMPTHSYIFVPTRELWPAPSVNARCPSPATKKVPRQGKAGTISFADVPMPPTQWLDQNRHVEQMTWVPGESMVIPDKLMADGGWIDHPGASCFNLYRPPVAQQGDAQRAQPWLDHIARVFPEDAGHIVHWLAHRVQRPGEKINHALVLGGAQGIGKDTILEPVKRAIGPWNFADITPLPLLDKFNGFVKSTILRISEGHDLGDVDRYAFYEHLKVYTAAPPDVLRCNEKHIREHAVMNVCGVIITTNHKTDGLYLPADDRRHFVAWSPLERTAFDQDYWRVLYQWYEDGGHGHVAAYLAALDLSGFNPKAPPPKTAAFWDIVDAGRAPEDAELADALDALKNPAAITLVDIAIYADESFREWLHDRSKRRQIPHRLEEAGYVPVRNPTAKDGLWKVNGKRTAVYARKELPLRDQLAAAGQCR